MAVAMLHIVVFAFARDMVLHRCAQALRPGSKRHMSEDTLEELEFGIRRGWNAAYDGSDSGHKIQDKVICWQ